MKAALSLIPVAFVLSLYMHGYRDVIYAPTLWVLLVAFMGAIVVAFRSSKTLPLSAPVLLMTAFWNLTAINQLWSSVPYISLQVFLIFSALPLTFFTLLFFPLTQLRLSANALSLRSPLPVGEREEVRSTSSEGVLFIALFFSIIFIALSLFALYQHFIGGSDYGHRAHKPLLDPNNLATLFAMVLVPATAFAATIPKGKTKSVALGFCALLFSALLATQSRGGLLSTLLSLVVLFFLLKKDVTKKTILITASIAFFIIALAVFFLHPLSDPDIADRLYAWKATLNMIIDHPWAGTGFGTYALYYPAYRFAGLDRSLGQWAHNDPLQLWAEMGLAAPILFYALLVAILMRTLKALKFATHRTMIAGTFCGLLTLALMTHINFCLAVMPILIVAGTLLALWHRAIEEVTPSPQTLPLRLKTAAPFAAFLILILAAQSFSAAAGSYYFQRGATARQAGDINGFIDGMNKAERLAPISFIDPAVERADALFSLITQPNTPPDRRDAMIKNARTLLDQAAQWNPVWARIDFVRGNLAFSEGQIDGAKSLWQTALRKNPTYVPARQALIQVDLSYQHTEEVKRLVQNGMRYPHTRMMDGWYRDILSKIEATP